MSSFVLPITIDSRKIIFLDLEPHQEEYYENKSVDEDIYIVEELYQQNNKDIIFLSSSHSLLAVHDEEDHIKVSDLEYKLDYDETENILSISLKKKKGAEEIKKKYANFLYANTANNDLRIFIKEKSASENRSIGSFFVKFLYEAQDGEIYGSMLQFMIAERSDVKFVGLDFGSEASQMIDGNYDPSNQQNIESEHTRIFSDIRKNNNQTPNADKDFTQFDEKDTLYRSVFFVEKNISTAATRSSAMKAISDGTFALNVRSIDFMTLNAIQNTQFFRNWQQIPNLKLIHGQQGGAFGNQRFTIKCSDGEFTESFVGLKSSIYKRLLSEMITCYLKENFVNNCYLRFTVLVPNIYGINNIVETKRIVRKIINDYTQSSGIDIKGIEISSLSESDASFMGSLSGVATAPGKYYLTIDCGKGTTDFSIVMIDEKNPQIMKPVYRSGFAGAGNLISFAIMESVIYFLINGLNADKSKVSDEEMVKFFKDMCDGQTTDMAYLKRAFFESVERWKFNYDKTISRDQINEEWLKARDVTMDFAAWFAAFKTSQTNEADLIKLISKIDHIFDWNGYIDESAKDIAELVESNISDVILHLNKKSKCAGVLLTGRAFKFAPLHDAVKNKVREISGMKGVEFISIDNQKLKEVCLKGVFTRNIVSYADIASTPIEIKKGTLTKSKKADNSNTNGWGMNVFKKAWTLMTNPDEDFLMNDESLVIPLINTDLNNIQFLSGGQIFSPANAEKCESAELIQTRRGYIIRATRKSEPQIAIMGTYLDGTPQGEAKKIVEAVKKSLIPGIVDTGLIRSLKL